MALRPVASRNVAQRFGAYGAELLCCQVGTAAPLTPLGLLRREELKFIIPTTYA